MTILAPQLGGPRQRHLRDLLSPWFSARAVRRAAASHGVPDVVDASSAEGLLLARSRRAAWSGTAVVARSHGLEHLNYERLLQDAREGLAARGPHRRVWYPAVRMRAVAAAARRADALIVLNEGDRRFAIERGWLPPDRIEVVPHGLTRAFLDPPPEAPGGSGLLFCGSWDRVKGVDYLAAAFSRVGAERPGARLTVLGAGVDADRRVRGAFAPSVRDRVRVVARLPEAQVAAEYRRHDALVMCSTYEGFGMVVPEAMSQRLAVIATPVGAAASLVRDGETGLLVRPRDGSGLAAAMRRLLDDPALRARLASAGAERVRAMSWDATAQQTVAVYERALARRRRHGR